MINSKKKGFTIVELVIVIAVIAVLAAVLIPTFSNLVKKANVTADQQAVVQMNKILKMDEGVNGKPADKDAVIKLLVLNDYNEGFNTYYTGHTLGWLESENIIVLIENGKVVYPESYSDTDVAEIDELKPMATTAEDIFAALGSANGETIYLNENLIVANKEMTFNDPIDVVLDLNGKSITSTSNEGSNAVRARNGNVTLKNGTVNGSEGDWSVLSCGADNPATLTVENMMLVSRSTRVTDSGHGAMAVKTYHKDAVITISDSTLMCINGGGIETSEAGTIILNNVVATQSGDAAAAYNTALVAGSSGGTAIVNGGTYTGHLYCVFVYSSGGTVKITDGKFEADVVLKNDHADSTIYVSGGVFTGKIELTSGSKIEITGGVFGKSFDQLTEADWLALCGNANVEITQGKVVLTGK